MQRTSASGISNPSNCLPPCSSQFTLHGLWPNYEKGHCPGKKGAWPQNCDDSSTDLPPECDCPFDLSLLSDLQSSMLQNWPSYGQANANFWKHEWDKHGRQEPSLLQHVCCTMKPYKGYLSTAVAPLHWPRNLQLYDLACPVVASVYTFACSLPLDWHNIARLLPALLPSVRVYDLLADHFVQTNVHTDMYIHTMTAQLCHTSGVLLCQARSFSETSW